MERFLEAVSLKIKGLGSLWGRNEGLVEILLYQGVKRGFVYVCHPITTRNDRNDLGGFNEINGLADVAAVEQRVIEKRVGLNG